VAVASRYSDSRRDSVDEIAVDKVYVDIMTVDKMSVDDFCIQNDCNEMCIAKVSVHEKSVDSRRNVVICSVGRFIVCR
jgi:hypothetical protein